MKSKTSFSKGTLLKKDLTRFAPVWGLYLVALLLGLILMAEGLEYWFIANLADLIQAMGAINLCYALVTAQLLFGDLFQSRMCNGLHALPLDRGALFEAHLLSGLLFSLIPTAVFTGVSLQLTAFSVVENAWQVPLFWFVAANLEYAFFFSLAVLSIQCSGNRAGAALVYGILNSLSFILYFLVDTVCTPMLHGVVTQSQVFELLCPVSQLTMMNLVNVSRRYETVELAADFAKGWMYLGILTMVGAALLVLALVLYKRRHLECAGDLLSTRKLEPVFMVLYSLVLAAVFQLVNQLFSANGEGMYLFLAVGLAVGWFTGRMLVERQVQVFRRGKNWLGFALLAAAVTLSLFAVSRDPFGVEDWMPRAEDVERVVIGIGYRGEVELTEPEEIEEALYFHSLLLEEKLTEKEIAAKQHITAPEVENASGFGIETITIEVPQPVYYRNYREASSNVHIIYTLKNGWRAERNYSTWMDTEQGQMLRRYMSTVEAVFSSYSYIDTAQDLRSQACRPEAINVNGHAIAEAFRTEEAVRELMEAIIADCEAGTLAQYTNFHDSPVLVIDEEKGHYQHCYSVTLYLKEDTGLNFDVYADSENCLAWLEATGITDDIREMMENALG